MLAGHDVHCINWSGSAGFNYLGIDIPKGVICQCMLKCVCFCAFDQVFSLFLRKHLLQPMVKFTCGTLRVSSTDI